VFFSSRDQFIFLYGTLSLARRDATQRYTFILPLSLENNFIYHHCGSILPSAGGGGGTCVGVAVGGDGVVSIARGGDYYGRCEVQALAKNQMMNTGNRYWLQPSFLCCRDMQSSSRQHPCTYLIVYSIPRSIFPRVLFVLPKIRSTNTYTAGVFSYETSLHVMKSLGVEIVGMSHEYGYDCIPEMRVGNYNDVPVVDLRLALPLLLILVGAGLIAH
jgi:hypothetical protein